MRTCHLIVLLLAIFLSPNLKAQTRYVIPGLNNYFTAYKNGLNIDILNDSIKTNFYQIDNSHFVVKFYINNNFRGQCNCTFQGKEDNITSTILSCPNGDGKQKAADCNFQVKYLEPVNRTCLLFLPPDLYSRPVSDDASSN